MAVPSQPTEAPSGEQISPAPSAPSAPSSATISPEQFAALGGSTIAIADSQTGYIDSAIPRNQFRFRFDAAYDNNRPDRAEFIYAKCGCNPGGNGPIGQGNHPVETSLDFQDFSMYLELAASNNLSGFVELPVRLVNGEFIDNTGGLGDMNVGFKYAFIACPDHYLTFQFKTYIPTGDADRGLGTDHVSLEPGLLCYKRLSDRVTLEGELRDWIPVDGSDFAGNVIRYGVGLSYQTCCSGCRVTPIAELVGWTVLDGRATVSPDGTGERAFIEDSEGDTIVNVKLGVRFGIGQAGDVYVGYGRALTGDVWYEDMIRVEYRLNF
jgi:Putative MetA-pathway of phenol degradation